MNVNKIILTNNNIELSRLCLSSVLTVNDKNKVFAGVCNQGARAANKEILLFIINNTKVHEAWLKALEETLGESSK
jgi:hypothetical protein